MKPRRALLAAYFASPLLVSAGTSANYSLAPDTVDEGGLRGVSANYTVNLSATAGGAGASAHYTARTGFAGQLFDGISAAATAITLDASPPSVNEGATRQLSASLLFDDGSTTPLSTGKRRMERPKRSARGHQ